MNATIRLFKAVPITKRNSKELHNAVLKMTLKKGFIFSPEVIYNYSEKELLEIIRLAEKEVGLSAEQMNASFHKSWLKVKCAGKEQLFLEQMMHYITTYGFEQLGCYDKNTVYVPHEKIDIPKINEDVHLIVIKGYTKIELKEKILELLRAGIAFGEDTINDIVEIASFVGLNDDEIESIQNKEVKIRLYDTLKTFPKNPVEFLRYVVYKATGKTLLIKNHALIQELKDVVEHTNAQGLLVKYNRKHGLRPLATIFYRFKPLFLALKTNKQTNTIVNKIRKLAVKYHKPMKEDYLNIITTKLKNGEKIYLDILKGELADVNTFRKIRLAYALKYRTKDVASILYKVRNGKGYATSFNSDVQSEAKRIFDIVYKTIVNDVAKNVKGKKIFIPKNITYALPATEKQFTGDFPSGTFVTVPKNIIAGIHWTNLKEDRVDLDLSLISPGTGKMGWDGSCRNQSGSILFSGDIVDAPPPQGASEIFYVRQQLKNELIMYVNYYNYRSEHEVPFKIIVAEDRIKNLTKNYVVNPNKVVTIAKTKINQKEMVLGLLITTTNECRFYYAQTGLGCSISASNNKFGEHARRYLIDYYTNTINLNKVLEAAGAVMVDESVDCDINLSPETLEKDSIIRLLI